MKNLIKILLPIALILILTSCDKPLPTELSDEAGQSENLEVEIITKDTEDEYYSNGFDTSGVVQTTPVSIINITGGKVSFQGQTEKFSFAQTIIFDRNNPVYNNSGRLIGFKTITPGVIRFNDLLTRLVDCRVRFREAGQVYDTLLGKKYVLYKGRGFMQDNFEFPFNSYVSFHFNPLIGQPVGFNIPTPSEIFGSVRLEGSKAQNNLRAILEWNADNYPKFFIIIGVGKRNSKEVFPLYRIKTQDDGRVVIPAKLFNDISRDRFDRLSFTFIRSFDNRENLDSQNVLVLSQSIHTIYVVLP